MQKILSSVSGENLLEFERVRHRYKLNGEYVDSVTGILKKGFPMPERLINWKVKNATTWKKKSTEAADIGTFAHKFAELKAKGKATEYDWNLVNAHKDKEKIYNCIELFEAWFMQKDSVIIDTEVLVASPMFKYAGTIDVLSETEEGYGIEDYKTSAGFYVEQFLQIAGGYSIAAYEWLGKPIKWVRINLFGKTSPSFDTLKVNGQGWYFNGKLIKVDTDALKLLRFQWGSCLQTTRFNERYEEMFDDLYESRKAVVTPPLSDEAISNLLNEETK